MVRAEEGRWRVGWGARGQEVEGAYVDPNIAFQAVRINLFLTASESRTRAR